MTTLAHQRFLKPIQQLSTILVKTKSQKDKALGLYQGNARDVLFRLEALCRVYRKSGDKKFFNYWYKEFKHMEDLLGRMDHYEEVHKEFSGYKEFKKSADKIFRLRHKEIADFLTGSLMNDGWLSGEKMQLFTDGLAEVKWMEEDEDLMEFGDAMCDELDKLVDKYRSGELDPYKLEAGMHEFRRRLRWISIYAQAANGTVQLRAAKKIPADLAKYCPKEISSSPFNAMEKAPKGKAVITIQSHYFYALSWLILRLSNLKDVGIRTEAFNEMMHASGTKDAKLVAKFKGTCDFDPEQIATLAESDIDDFIYKDFITERIWRDIMRSLA